MDIKNMFDFESKVNFLISSDKANIKESIENQKDFLDSEIINENFSKIETYLNDMYERVRVLEEVIEYTKIYVNSEIDSTITECRDLLSEIENINETIFNDTKNFTTINVPLSNSNVIQHSDRNGATLKTCEFYNGMISLSGNLVNSIPVKNIEVKRQEQVYEANIKDLLSGEAYRAHYLMDSTVKNGIKEEVNFTFNQATELNSIKFKLSNCSIENIIYIHQDNTESIDSNISKGIIPGRVIKGLKIILTSSNYVPKTITVTSNKLDSFENLDRAWKDYSNQIKESDNTYSLVEYKSNMTDYLEDIYLKEGNK